MWVLVGLDATLLDQGLAVCIEQPAASLRRKEISSTETRDVRVRGTVDSSSLSPRPRVRTRTQLKAVSVEGFTGRIKR